MYTILRVTICALIFIQIMIDIDTCIIKCKKFIVQY